MCRKWECSRGPIGSQWAWLRHRITQINRQLSQLDSTMQRRPKQEPFLLTSPSRSLSPLTNPPSGVWGVGVDRGKVVNGTSHASTSVPHLLLPDGILNGPIQVCIPETGPVSVSSWFLSWNALQLLSNCCDTNSATFHIIRFCLQFLPLPSSPLSR